MAMMGKGVRCGVVLGLLVALLVAGGCSTKEGVSGDKPPAKGSGCSLGIVRIFG